MTTHQILDERYGRTRSRAPRWLIAAGVAVAGAVVIGAGWMTVAGALDDVDVRTTGFQLVDDASVRIDFQVTAPGAGPSRAPWRRRMPTTVWSAGR